MANPEQCERPTHAQASLPLHVCEMQLLELGAGVASRRAHTR